MSRRTTVILLSLVLLAVCGGLSQSRVFQLLKGSSNAEAEDAPSGAAGPTPPPAQPAPPTPSLIAIENSQPGTADWRVTNFADAGEIAGYAGSVSVNPGEQIDLFVSTAVNGTRYRVDIFRMGWYGGMGARLMLSVPDLVGAAQGYYTPASGLAACVRCKYDSSTGLLDANWQPSYSLPVPTSWVSGMYLARLTDARGKQSYISFVVRQDTPASALLLKLSVNTYEAYNAWGGKSLYASDSTGAMTAGGSPAAVKVSFNRPFDADNGSGQFLRYEYNLVRWVERQGYDVSYTTDADVSDDPSSLFLHRGFISAGHDEYWTASERANVTAARDHGLNLAFLSGDAVYWQARYESSAAGVADRTLVEYRGRTDPLFTSDPQHATVRWQDAPVSRPENALTGTSYSSQAEPFTQDWVAADTSSWLFTGTGLRPGDHVSRLVGKEFDRADLNSSSPAGLQILSHSPISVPAVDRPPATQAAESTLYTARSGAVVFSAATITWSWGLDDASYPIGTGLHNTPVSPAIQRLTQNLLDRFVGAPAAMP